MEKIVLKSDLREASECVSSLRAEKVIPAVVYGKNQENTTIKLDNSDLLRAFRVVGTTESFTLEINGKNLEATIKDFQKHPVTGDFLHVDFYVA
ncbi:MAG: 50S ribosomal protein L25 [Candidatus Gracilibacteria bacterium]|nr:50S ribosomal protein L25 [Candidatus Gracilibacteria bacterium]